MKIKKMQSTRRMIDTPLLTPILGIRFRTKN